MMIEFVNWLLIWLNDNVFIPIYHSHEIFWNENYIFFVAYIVCLTVIFTTRNNNSRAQRLFAAFSICSMLGFSYNPLINLLFMQLPSSSEAVYSRIWIFLPVWMVIASSTTKLIDTKEHSSIRHSVYAGLAIVIVVAGTSLSSINSFTEIDSLYKVENSGIEVAEKVLLHSGTESVGVLLFRDSMEGEGNFIQGGTMLSTIKQYTGYVGVYPVDYDEQIWNDYYISTMLPDGETTSSDYINDCLIDFRRCYDFSYIVMPQDLSLRNKMSLVGYQYIACVNESDIYVAKPKWQVQSLANLMENSDKVYLISDNNGHFILVDGGCKSDRRQLQQILYLCGNHVDAWIMTNPSSENLEGFNLIVSTDGYTVDKVYIPAIDIESIPEGFMDEQDQSAFNDFIGLSEAGLFEIAYVSKGDSFECYGMTFQILSDMLNIQSGSIEDNSMLFRMEAGNKSFLFCSSIGYEQGMKALCEYGEELKSNYVQIASGSGNGLGYEFYEAVNPDIAFCDSICDDAGRQSYELLTSLGIKCYCLENGDTSVVIIE